MQALLRATSYQVYINREKGGKYALTGNPLGPADPWGPRSPWLPGGPELPMLPSGPGWPGGPWNHVEEKTKELNWELITKTVLLNLRFFLCTHFFFVLPHSLFLLLAIFFFMISYQRRGTRGVTKAVSRCISPYFTNVSQCVIWSSYLQTLAGKRRP